ncbi:MAG: ribosome biogenesis GTPase Der [Chitinophagales bacterium]|nr:ribosome biogenesis GTPase Der [Chitinophagales bacterium]
MSFTVAIVGRPNVGKSTLFNRLIGEKKSIIDDVSGVTRDRIYGESEWGGKKFNVIDTGGFVPRSEEVFEKHIREQALIAIEEASLLLFMVDAATGITDLDDEFANILRKSQKNVFLVVNKVDNIERRYDANEFYSLGIDNVFFIASMTGSGTGELLDAVVERIPNEPQKEEDAESNIPKVCIIGQPNVGKSSLVNSLLGEERNIVTNIAGTTRDSVHTHYNKFGKQFILIDTAGIRRKSKVHENLEFYSVIRAVKALDEADIAVIVLDATKGITHQDLSIYKMAVKKHRGIIVAVNKWDLIEKTTNTARDFEAALKSKLAPFNDVPIVFMSAIEKQRIFRVLETIEKVYENMQRKIPTSQLNEVMLKAIEQYRPPATDGKLVSIKYVTQLPTRSPAFAFFSNHPKYIRESYRNYLENKLRENFEFNGVPMNIFFREK